MSRPDGPHARRWGWRLCRLLLAGLVLGCAHADDVPSPQAVVETVVAEALQVLATESDRLAEDRDHAIALLQTRLLPHVDLPRMARFALGPHWRGATPDQRQRFTQAFHAEVVRTLAVALQDHAEELARISRSLKISYRELSRRDQRVTLRALLESPRFGRLEIDLLLHAEDGPWKLYDLHLAGVSILLNYRSQITAAVSRDGLEAVIARMQ
jgi:phospholipid transport system substrate-binding protein